MKQKAALSINIPAALTYIPITPKMFETICSFVALVAGACSERKKMFLGGSFLKLADNNKYIKNPEAQNREVRGF